MSFHKKLRMPKPATSQGGSFLAKEFIPQFFDEMDDLLIYNAEYGEHPFEVVSYKKEDSWVVVHPSATETIATMDIQYKLGLYCMRDIVKVNALVNVPQYWTKSE
jgi:hypothetical protein